MPIVLLASRYTFFIAVDCQVTMCVVNVAEAVFLEK